MMTSTDGSIVDLAWIRPHSAPTDALPHPTRTRWQPLRLGLVDLFYYDDEQFWFHDGRLLLRGNNGTGKSKVLALTLPFVLDGSASPRRVEPDSDPKKRMEWNLLLGGAHPHSERTGYTWVEFGRVDADGIEHFLTLGVGLKAASGRGVVKSWYFTSTRRIGDLRLIGPDRIVRTQERLRDELAADRSGFVYTTQETYRRAVDEALFKLDVERYGALIDLLIQLRQPQLSKKLDEKALSAALTEALTPLDQAMVADVAESFRSLEEERSAIETMREMLSATESFLQHYRSYGRIAARRRTTGVREANSGYERVGRGLRDAENDAAAAADEAERLDAESRDLGEQRSELYGEQEALRGSDAVNDERRLSEASRAAEEAAERAGKAGLEAERARGAVEKDGGAATEAENRYDEAVRESAVGRDTAAGLAAAAGLEARHAALVGDKDAADRAMVQRRDEIRHVRGLLREAQAADERDSHLRGALDDAETEQARREESVTAAEAAVESLVTTYSREIDRYLAELTLLAVPDGIEERAAAWARALEGSSPAHDAIVSSVRRALAEIGRARAAAEEEGRRLGAERAAVRTEIDELEAGWDPEPPPAPARAPRQVADRPGAPLWRVADFRPDVAEPARAATEAALASAGLLDAWIFPDGSLVVDDDVVLGADGPVASPSLAEVLVAAVGPGDAIEAAVVTDALQRIGLTHASVAPLWIDTDGRWGAGPVRGSWHKDRPEYIGAGAREAHRRELLADLRRRDQQIGAEIDAVRQRIDAAADREARVHAEEECYPAGEERQLIDADRAVTTTRSELGRAKQVAGEARARWEAAAAASADARTELDDRAALLRLGDTDEALDRAEDALAGYAQSLAQARHAARRLAEAEGARILARRRADEAIELLQSRTWDEIESRNAALSRRALFETLQTTVGASVAELHQRLEAVGKALRDNDKQQHGNEVARLTAAARIATVQEKIRGLTERRNEATAARDAEVRALRDFAVTGLLRVALPDLRPPDAASPGSAPVDEQPAGAWNITSALAFARNAEQRLDGIEASDEAWSRAQQRVSSAMRELTTHMSRHGHAASTVQHDDVMIAQVRYLGDEVPVDRLADRLAADVADRERLLSAREREILENHLVSEIAGHLHELLLSAEGQIDGTNQELARRTTSTGMQLRVRWRERPDSPAGLAAARKLLLRSDATWTASDRSAIGEFLQERIADVRQSDPTGSWQEHLEQALDYRQWHVFAVERWQNGQWRSAAGPASGGEKALTVSVPLFAAAAAHYNSADDLAPRLILLDEAFAGVDDDSRAKSLGLLATFDLDVVMTSEREWGCYPQVPGLSIAQLSRQDGVDAVGVTRWRWDGRCRERLGDIDSAATASGSPPAPEPTDDATLFG